MSATFWTHGHSALSVEAHTHRPGDEKRMVVNLDPKGYDEWLSCSEKKGLKLAPEGSIHNFELAPTFQLHEVGFGILRGRREALHTLPGRFATPILKVVIAEKFQSLRFPEIPTESDASRVNINLPIAEAKFS